MCGTVYGLEFDNSILVGESRQLTDLADGPEINSQKFTVYRSEDGFSISGWSGEVGLAIWWNKDYHNYLFERDDGVEWAFRLDENPGVNTMMFPCLSWGLNLNYQDTLMDMEKSFSHRPDSVIGSYALYHASGRNNIGYGDGTTSVYRAGKFGHIFRPYAYDSKGDTTWLEQRFEGGWYTLTLPDGWLDNAKYPVIVDPTLGYTSVGASMSGADNIFGFGGWTATEDGTADSVTVYVQITSADITLGIYSDDGAGYPDALLRDGPGGAGSGVTEWQSRLLDASYSLVNGTIYWVGIDGAASIAVYYDAGTKEAELGGVPTYVSGTLETPFSAQTTNLPSRDYSGYIYYTVSGSPATIHLNKVHLGKVKIGTN